MNRYVYYTPLQPPRPCEMGYVSFWASIAHASTVRIEAWMPMALVLGRVYEVGCYIKYEERGLG